MTTQSQNIDFAAAKESGNWAAVDSAIVALLTSTEAGRTASSLFQDVAGDTWSLDLAAARVSGDWAAVDGEIESRFGATAMVAVELESTVVTRKGR